MSVVISRQVATKCFSGLHLKTCKSVVPTDPTIYNYETQYYKITLASSPQAYCLQCCGLNPDRIDNWHIRCALDVFTASTSNLYGYEFRLGTQEPFGGNNFISCPLKRRACSYTQNGILIGCDPTDKHYLHGYVLNLNIVRYTSNFQSWRGISSCTASAIESNITLSSGDIFTETINMNWNQAPFQSNQPLNLAFFSFFGVLSIYFILLFTRRKHCPICQKKLLLCPNRCYVCIFLGADLPDPMLALALENKERRILRGELNSSPTILSSIATVLKDFSYYICKTPNFFCCGVKKKATVHPLDTEDAASKADKSSRDGSNKLSHSDLELQKYASDSPEQQYYKRGQTGLQNDPRLPGMDPSEVSTLSPEVQKNDIFENDILGSAKSSVNIEVTRVKGIKRRLYGFEKNHRTLLFSKDSIANAVDDEYVTKKPTGVTKNKFIARSVVKVVETLA